MSFFTRFFGAGKHHQGEQIPDPFIRSQASDITVSEDLALQQSAVFASCRLIASTMGTLPLELFRTTEAGRSKANDVELYDILKNRPNKNMDGVVFWEYMAYSLAMHGNAYALKRKRGTVKSLLPFHPQQMSVFLNTDTNTLQYKYSLNGKQIPYSQDQILHIRLFGNGHIGFSPLSFSSSSIGLSNKNDKMARGFADSGGKATGVFKVEKLLNPEERRLIRENIIKPIEDTGGSSTVLLELGTDYKPIQINPVDLQMLETRRFSVEDIARIFGVPSILINDMNSSTTWGSGIEQIIRGFYKLTLRQYLIRTESAVRQQVLTQEQRETLKPEFNMEALLRGDSETRSKFYSTMVQNGLKTRNEVRKMENDPPLDGGDKLTVQSNLVNIENLQGSL